jgi:hypothetical protein
MKRLASALVLAAACGGGPGDGSMPDGQNLRPDGDNDTDLDGIKNDVDNCPTATNAYQGNEDGDKFGDACDPCPVVADDNPPDADSDGVADACDPMPSYFGDRLAFFEGFHQGVPQGWDKTGSWSTSNDEMVGSATGEAHFALIATDRTRETISAKVLVTSVAGSASEVGLLDNKMQSGTSAIACALTGGAKIAVYDTANRAGATESAYELTAGETYIIKLRRENATYTCSADRAGTAGSAQKSITLNNMPYLSGFKLEGAGVRVQWFMVVESL